MSYTERLMSTGERISLRDRQHWFVVIASGRWAVAAIVLALVIFFVRVTAAPTGFVADLLGIVAAVSFIAGVILLGWEVLRYVNQEYIITNRRVIQVSGVVNKHAADSSLEKINDADLSQSLLGRMFNFGDLDVLTASDAGIDRFRMIHDPVEFKRAMLDAKHEYEQDMSRGPGSSSPPLRTAPERPVTEHAAAGFADHDATSSHPVAAAPTAAMPAPAAAAPRPAETPSMSAEEVTRTLASLADLRDRGALSEEEFERKKADLLGRL
jgi:hypothetical protein